MILALMTAAAAMAVALYRPWEQPRAVEASRAEADALALAMALESGRRCVVGQPYACELEGVYVDVVGAHGTLIHARVNYTVLRAYMASGPLEAHLKGHPGSWSSRRMVYVGWREGSLIVKPLVEVTWSVDSRPTGLVKLEVLRVVVRGVLVNAVQLEPGDTISVRAEHRECYFRCLYPLERVTVKVGGEEVFTWPEAGYEFIAAVELEVVEEVWG